MHSLSDSTQGYTYTIKWMFGLPEVMKSMHDMDIHEGSTVRVLRKFHDSLIISSANRKIVLGNEVAVLGNERLAPGSYNYQFSADNNQLSSGVYFYRLETGDFVETKRMILLK